MVWQTKVCCSKAEGFAFVLCRFSFSVVNFIQRAQHSDGLSVKLQSSKYFKISVKKNIKNSQISLKIFSLFLLNPLLWTKLLLIYKKKTSGKEIKTALKIDALFKKLNLTPRLHNSKKKYNKFDDWIYSLLILCLVFFLSMDCREFCNGYNSILLNPLHALLLLLNSNIAAAAAALNSQSIRTPHVNASRSSWFSPSMRIYIVNVLCIGQSYFYYWLCWICFCAFVDEGGQIEWRMKGHSGGARFYLFIFLAHFRFILVSIVYFAEEYARLRLREFNWIRQGNISIKSTRKFAYFVVAIPFPALERKALWFHGNGVPKILQIKSMEIHKPTFRQIYLNA